jgi:beta-mannosidase
MGEPNLYELRVDMTHNGEMIDIYQTRTGLRTFERRNGWESYLNGKRFFWRGANYLSDQLLSNVSRASYSKDIRLMREANMNMVRTFCVVEKDEFYDICDEQGLLVYQDFPMQWQMTTASEFIRRATIQAREMIDFLFNHPSIMVWCFGSEPGIRNFTKLGTVLKSVGEAADPGRISQQANESMARWPTPKAYLPYGWLIDMHFYMGWYSYRDRPVAEFFGRKGTTVFDLKKIPKEFFEVVTEYGSQSLPDMDCMSEILPNPTAWPPDWKILKHHCMQPEIHLSHIPQPHNMNDLITLSQEYQAFVLKYHTEYYRKLKYKPCNGALIFAFSDCWPAITWSVVDYKRHPKLGYEGMKRNFNPVHVLLDWWDPLETIVGRSWEIRILVVNDLHRDFLGAEVHWVVTAIGDRTLADGNVVTDIVSDSPAVSIGKVTWIPAEEGLFVVALDLWHEGRQLSANEYTITARKMGDEFQTRK